MTRILLVMILGFVVSGCAVGNTHRLDLGDATLDVESSKTVAVTTMDIRPYVRDGDKSPDFVGLQRGGFGNPFDVTTDSGNPLADDITLSIVKALQTSKIDAVAVKTAHGTGIEQVRETLLAATADRYALFVVRDWNSDTAVNTGLSYDLTLSVLQQDGTSLAAKTLSGHDNLGSSLVPADARVNTEKAFRQKLEEAFGDPEIKTALQ